MHAPSLLVLLLSATAAATPATDVFALSASDNRVYSVLANVNVTDTLPFNGTSWGRGIVSSCLDGKRLFTFASGVGSSAVVLAGISVNGSGSILTFTTPFLELSNVFMMGMYPPLSQRGRAVSSLSWGASRPPASGSCAMRASRRAELMRL